MFGGDKVAAATMMGIWGTTFNALAMISIPGVLWVSRHVGKHRAIMIALGMVCISAALKFVLYTPEAPYLQMLIALLHAPGLAAYLVLVNSMTADIVDYDESLNGERREALIAAANTWITKTGVSLSFIFAGLVLNMTDFDAAKITQEPDTVLGMRICFSAIPVAGTLLGLVVLRSYPLSKQKVGEIQAFNEERRTLAAAAAS